MSNVFTNKNFYYLIETYGSVLWTSPTIFSGVLDLDWRCGSDESKKSCYSFDIMTQIKKLQDLLYFKGTINQCSVMLKNLEDNDLDISLKISVSILNY